MAYHISQKILPSHKDSVGGFSLVVFYCFCLVWGFCLFVWFPTVLKLGIYCVMGTRIQCKICMHWRGEKWNSELPE